MRRSGTTQSAGTSSMFAREGGSPTRRIASLPSQRTSPLRQSVGQSFGTRSLFSSPSPSSRSSSPARARKGVRSPNKNSLKFLKEEAKRLGVPGYTTYKKENQEELRVLVEAARSDGLTSEERRAPLKYVMERARDILKYLEENEVENKDDIRDQIRGFSTKKSDEKLQLLKTVKTIEGQLRGFRVRDIPLSPVRSPPPRRVLEGETTVQLRERVKGRFPLLKGISKMKKAELQQYIDMSESEARRENSRMEREREEKEAEKARKAAEKEKTSPKRRTGKSPRQ